MALVSVQYEHLQTVLYKLFLSVSISSLGLYQGERSYLEVVGLQTNRLNTLILRLLVSDSNNKERIKELWSCCEYWLWKFSGPCDPFGVKQV